MTKRTLLLLVGGGGASPTEHVIRRACQAAARDLLESTLGEKVVHRAVLATDDAAWASSLAHLPVEIDLDAPGTPFHFGQRLIGLIRRFGVQHALYAGGGSAPLMGPVDWQQALAGLDAAAAMTNNLHSSDWVAFPCTPESMSLLADQERDNSLAWRLRYEGGLPVSTLPPSAASRFDIDTPADLLIARAHPRLGTHLRSVLDSLPWPVDIVGRILQVMEREGGRIAVIGRSASAAWQALEEATRCEVRFFVEERGMIASGRMERGEVRSLLASFAQQVGADGLIGELAAMVEAVLLDSRVLLAAQGLWPPAAERFNADLFQWQQVSTPFLRDLSRAAANAGIPILMGGQSVVNGGLLALIETLKASRRL